mgnify:CR=1 FL=1
MIIRCLSTPTFLLDTLRRNVQIKVVRSLYRLPIIVGSRYYIVGPDLNMEKFDWVLLCGKTGTYIYAMYSSWSSVQPANGIESLSAQL